jgi:hypothetical protein
MPTYAGALEASFRSRGLDTEVELLDIEYDTPPPPPPAEEVAEEELRMLTYADVC